MLQNRFFNNMYSKKEIQRLINTSDTYGGKRSEFINLFAFLNGFFLINRFIVKLSV